MVGRMADEDEEKELDGLRDRVTDLEDQLRSAQESLRLATIRLEATERNADDAKAAAQEALEAAQDAISVTGDGDGGGDDDDEPETPPPLDPSVSEPYAYKVMESSGLVFCYVPKKPEQEEAGNSGAKELYGGAYGGPHLGSKENPKADKDSPPYAKAGYEAGSGTSGVDYPTDFSWAHYGWHQVGSVTPQSGETVEKVVVASFKVPLDPPEDQRGAGTKVEGPSLSDISLKSMAEWKSDCENSWEQFDPSAGSGTSVTRKVPIALVANGLVTQLCVGVPFVERGGNGDGDPTLVDSRDIPSGLPEHLSGKCQKSVDFYEYPTLAPSGLPGSGQYQKTTKTIDPVTGKETTTVTRTDDESEADKTVTDILQLYDFTKPDISVTEMPVPTPVDTDAHGNESVSGPVFLIRDPGGTGETCPTLKYTQLKLVDDRCPPPDVWLESGQGDSVTLKVRSWSKDSSGECVSGVTQYTFTPTSVDAPDCSAIKACISGETQTVVTDVFVSGDGNLYKPVRTAKALEWGAPSDVMIVSGTTCEDGGAS